MNISTMKQKAAIISASVDMVMSCVWYDESYRNAVSGLVGTMIDKSDSDLSAVSADDHNTISSIAKEIVDASFINHDMLLSMRLTLALYEYKMLDFIITHAHEAGDNSEMPFDLKHALGMAGSTVIEKEVLVKVLLKGTASSTKMSDAKKLTVLTYLAGEL